MTALAASTIELNFRGRSEAFSKNAPLIFVKPRSAVGYTSENHPEAPPNSYTRAPGADERYCLQLDIQAYCQYRPANPVRNTRVQNAQLTGEYEQYPQHMHKPQWNQPSRVRHLNSSHSFRLHPRPRQRQRQRQRQLRMLARIVQVDRRCSSNRNSAEPRILKASVGRHVSRAQPSAACSPYAITSH